MSDDIKFDPFARTPSEPLYDRAPQALFSAAAIEAGLPDADWHTLSEEEKRPFYAMAQALTSFVCDQIYMHVDRETFMEGHGYRQSIGDALRLEGRARYAQDAVEHVRGQIVPRKSVALKLDGETIGGVHAVRTTTVRFIKGDAVSIVPREAVIKVVGAMGAAMVLDGDVRDDG